MWKVYDGEGGQSGVGSGGFGPHIWLKAHGSNPFLIDCVSG